MSLKYIGDGDKIPIVKLFMTFVSVSFFLIVLINLIFTLPHYEKTILNFQKESSQAELNLNKNTFEKYVESRVKVLQDIASFPVVVNGVMQSSQDNADLKDFLLSVSLLGEQEKLTLIDMAADAIFSTNSDIVIEYDEKSLWFKELLDAGRAYAVNFVEYFDKIYIQIVVPVKYQDSVEGMLVAEIKADLGKIFGDSLANLQYGISLNKGRVAVKSNKFVVDSEIISAYIPGMDLVLNHAIDKSVFFEKKKKILFDSAVMISLSSFIAFLLFVVLGNRLLVRPYKDLTLVKQQLTMLGLAVENANDAMLITDAHDLDKGPKIIYVNKAFCRMTGYELEDISGSSPRILQGPKTDPEVLRTIKQCLKNKQPFNGELINYTKEGEEYWVEVNIVPVFDENGEVNQFAAIERDVTQAKKDRQELIEAKQDAEHASYLKSEFLANMSHELRTPLNSLLILSDLLRENEDANLSDEQLEYLNVIYDSGQDLLSLINDILDLAKVEAGKLEVHLENFSLQEFVNNVERKFSIIAQRKELAFSTDFSKTLPDTLYSDAVKLEQIIKNFISNALKFTAKGGINFRIYTPSSTYLKEEIGLKSDNYIAFSIADTGIGIPEDKQDLIFEAFQQADGSTSRRYGGTGLGLSICLEFSKLLSGELHVFSEEGKGSTFTLFLPMDTYQNTDKAYH